MPSRRHFRAITVKSDIMPPREQDNNGNRPDTDEPADSAKVTALPNASMRPQYSADGVKVPDHVLNAAALRNSQAAQSHSITTAAYYAFLVPILIIMVTAFFPITTRFVNLNISSRNFIDTGIGVVVNNGSSPNKRVVTISNETRGDILDFIVNFNFNGSSLTSVNYEPPPNQFVDVFQVGRRVLSDKSFQAALGVRNLREGDSINVGLTFEGSADGFAFSSITGDNVSRWRGVLGLLTYRNNALYFLVGGAIALILLKWLVTPYFRNYRVALRIGRYVHLYTEDVRLNPKAPSPVGQTIDEVIERMGSVIAGSGSLSNRAGPEGLPGFLKENGLILAEMIEAPRDTAGEQRVMIGAINILGHPTFRKFRPFANLKILIFQVSSQGEIFAWNHVTVERLLNTTGEMIELSTKKKDASAPA